MRTGHALLGIALAAGGCIYLPANGTPMESNSTVSLIGYGYGSGQLINVRVYNWETNANSTLAPNAVTGTTETYPGSNLYPWSKTVPAQGPTFWRPNMLGPGTSIAMGRLEISAVQQGNPLVTFTEAQQDCVMQKIDAGVPQITAGDECSEETFVARFDNSGVGQAPLTSNTFFVRSQRTVGQPTLTAGAISIAPVNVKIVRYTSPGASEVFAMICALPGSGVRRLMVVNHGGNRGTGAGDAYTCLDQARRGWVVAMTSYRGEPLYIPNEPNVFDFPAPIDDVVWESWNLLETDGTPLPVRVFSNGNIQTSLGEVMDVHRLLQLMLLEPNVDDEKVLMSGFSHGASITLRAVQSGAPVDAAIAISPATDWSDTVQDCTTVGNPTCDGVLHGTLAPLPPAVLFSTPSVPTMVGDTDPTPPGETSAIQRSYDWRSPLFFAKDLKIRQDVTLLIQHGAADDIVRPYQSCNLAAQGFRTTDAGRIWFAPTGAAQGVSQGGPNPACPGTSFSSTSRPIMDWGLNRSHLIVYGGVGHGDGAVLPQLADLERFVLFLEESEAL